MTLQLGVRNATTVKMLGGYRAVQSLGLFHLHGHQDDSTHESALRQ
jgi:hypothetical protein